MAQSKRINLLLFVTVIMALVIVGLLAVIYNLTPSISNYFQLQYALLTHQFLIKDQIQFFTNAQYPTNNKVSVITYNALLNGTLKPQLTQITRFIASNGIAAFPITTANPVIGNTLAPYAPNLNILIYANNKNIPNVSRTFYYIYPEQLFQYSVNCSALSNIQLAQIAGNSSMIKTYTTCASSNFETLQALVGVSNITATQIDRVFSVLNANYIVGSNDIYPLSSNAIIGTFLGYAASSTYGLKIINQSQDIKTIAPIRNIYSGNVVSGKVMLSDLYCWNSRYSTLTNFLQTAGYTDYPYLYQYQYNNSTFLCLTSNSTDSLMNASSNLDGSNTILNPRILNGTLLTAFPSYVLADSVAVSDTYDYLIQGETSTVNATIANPPYWFMQNSTLLLQTTKAPRYVFTAITANEYLLSTSLPISGQEPNYTLIKTNASYAGRTIQQSSTISNATTYIYSALLQNLTYQYAFNQSPSGTPVVCTFICEWNDTIVYQNFGYFYQYANPNFGYVELPLLNQTVYYTNEFSIVAQTPFINDSNPYNATYHQLCLHKSAFNCTFGLAPSAVFNQASNYTAFVIYQLALAEPNVTYVVNGQDLRGWTQFESYLNYTIHKNKLVTISLLNNAGVAKWTVTGTVNQVLIPFIVVTPYNFVINPLAYPEAQALGYSPWSIIVLALLIVGVPYMAYLIGRAKLIKI